MHQLFSNLQESVLNSLIREKREITVYLLNGFQLKGVLISYDETTLLIKNHIKEQLVFKHAVSTIAPGDNINLLGPL